jgi:hypothetical protein
VQGADAAGADAAGGGSGQVRRVEAKANEFGGLVQVFFFSLLSGWDPASAPRLLGSDLVLAGRIVAVLGCYVECSGNAPATPALAKAVVQLLGPRSVRLNSEAFVRRCVQYALSRVLLAAPAHVWSDGLQQELGWLQPWLLETWQEDADQEVAKMAGGNLALLQERVHRAAPFLAPLADMAPFASVLGF